MCKSVIRRRKSVLKSADLRVETQKTTSFKDQIMHYDSSALNSVGYGTENSTERK